MEDRYLFNMLSAVFAGNERCGRLDGECSRCPACPLHTRVDEGFDETIEDLCSICRQPFSASMFFCDLVSKHRVHASCAMDMLRAQECGPLRCPICREGCLSRMTPACAAEMLMQSRVVHPLRSVQPPRDLEPVARQQFLRESIRSLDDDLRALHETRNRLVADLRGSREGTPETPAVQAPENWWEDAGLALCIAVMGTMLCVAMNLSIEREQVFVAMCAAFAAVVCLASVCTWAATFAPRIYPLVVVAAVFLPAATCIAQYQDTLYSHT